jgi:hypothetical protein
MNKNEKLTDAIREYIFPFFALAMLFSFPFSESILSISSVLIFLLFLAPFNWKGKLEILKHNKSIWALTAVFFIYLIGLLFCTDWQTGIYEIKKNIFWLLLPVGVAVSKRLNPKQFWSILFIFLIFVTASTFIAAYKIIYQDELHLLNFRSASYVSHVAFSFQIIVCFFILGFSLFNQVYLFKKIHPVFRITWMTWLIFFLLFQKSLLGILSLYIATIYFIILLLKRIRSQWIKNTTITLLVIIFLSPFFYVFYVYTEFNKTLDVAPSEAVVFTAQGNTYSFDFENKQKENGHFVNWYICEKELEEAWNNRSNTKLYDQGATGYPIYYTLIRYMTSKGLKKDAEGIAKLTNSDIEHVKNGVANTIFVEKKYSLYPRIYETIWEMDYYKRTGNPNNQSLSQRFEYVKAAFYLIKKYPMGIGTGNFKVKFKEAYQQIHSPLDQELRLHVHNQYLSYMVKFGLLGMLLIFTLVFFSIYQRKQFKNPLLTILLIIILVSNLGEAIMETHMGLSFFLFFLSLFLWHSPNELSE